jgi:hypothetical protein
VDVFGWIGAVAGVAGVIVLLLTGWQLRVTILTRRDAQRAQNVSSTMQDLTVADSLANEVTARWKDERKARSLESRDLIAVQWRGDTLLEGHQVDLGGDVSGLSNQVGGMVDRFLALESQRLILVGPAGSGKTALAILMMLELLSRRAPSEPVPVMLSLSSWDPHTSIRPWIRRRIVSEYMPKTDDRQVWGAAVDRLIQRDLIIPILDGLDELAGPMRGMALDSINRAAPTQALVLTCRREEYRQVAAHIGPLTSASASEALPVTPTAAASYLMKRRGARDPQTWAEVVNVISREPQSQVREALSTPFMISLLNVVYEDPRTDPTEILDKAAFPTAKSIESRLYSGLMSAFKNRMLLSVDGRSWNPEKAVQWLGNLAVHLEQSLLYDIVLWQLPKAIGRPQRVAIAIVCALAGGVIAGVARTLVFGLAGGLLVGLIAGAVVSLARHGTEGPKTRLPVASGRRGSSFLRGNGPLHTAVYSGILGLGAGLLAHYLLRRLPAHDAFYAGCIAAILLGSSIGFPGWQPDTLLSEIDSAKGPRQQLAEERRRNVGFAAATAATLAVAVWGLGWKYGGAVVGFLLGCFASFVIDLLSMSWWSYSLARFVLAVSHTFHSVLLAFWRTPIATGSCGALVVYINSAMPGFRITWPMMRPSSALCQRAGGFETWRRNGSFVKSVQSRPFEQMKPVLRPGRLSSRRPRPQSQCL